MKDVLKEFLPKLTRPPGVIAASYAMVLFVGFFDYITNPEFSFSLFYLIPITYNAWYLNRKHGIAISITSGLTWLFVDLSSSNYINIIAPYWNSVIRMGFFLIVVILLSEIKYLYRNLENIVRERTNELTSEIRKKIEAEEELRKSRNLYQDLVENISEVYFSTDPSGYFRYISPNFYKTTGLSHQDIYNKTFFEVIHEPDRERIKNFYSDRIHRGITDASCEFRILLDGTAIWFEQNSRILINDDGEPTEIRNLLRDINERKAAEISLIKSELKYQKVFAEEDVNLSEGDYIHQMLQSDPGYIMKSLSQRIDDITERISGRIRQAIGFSSLASHELRTPLAIIRNQLEENLRSDTPEQQLRETTVSVYDEVLRLQRIIGDLLRLSKMEAGSFKLQREIVELDKIIKYFYDDAALLAEEKDIKVILCPINPLKADIDKSYFLQMLFNILDNALKYTPEKGTITIACDSNNKKASISIKDTGCGIPPSIIKKLYTPFYERNTQEGSWGTGLGLILSKWIAVLHHGDIYIESGGGHGTTVYIQIPIIT